MGTVLHAGSVEYDAAQKTYTITGSGENMWSVADAFQFVWKKVSGDVTLTADIVSDEDGNEHKKAALMLRQSLDADSVYADVALHASGLTSLQFRDEKGAITRKFNRTCLRRSGCALPSAAITFTCRWETEASSSAGGWLRIPLQGTFYVGLAFVRTIKMSLRRRSSRMWS